MKVDNRTYLIGGPPRVGKGFFAQKLARKIHGHVVSTDSIRLAAKAVATDTTSDLFILNTHENSLSEDEWLSLHVDTPEKAIENQNRESIALWPAIHGFIDSFVDDEYMHIIEGVALLPALVDRLAINQNHIIFIGNTNPLHSETMQVHAAANPESDWLHMAGYSSERIHALAFFIQKMSLYFKEEATTRGYTFIDLYEQDFHNTLDTLVENLANA